MFSKLHINNWRQFEDVEIDFHEHLTIITGTNGAGKTTILNLLSKCIGWEPQFVSSYEEDESGTPKYFNSIKEQFVKVLQNFKRRGILPDRPMDKLGKIYFSDGTDAELALPDKVSAGTYGIDIEEDKKIKGVYISSHRPNFSYKELKSISVAAATRDEICSEYSRFNKLYVSDNHRDHDKMSAALLIKKNIASLAVFGYGNQTVSENETAKQLFEGYTSILKTVLPPELEFEKISFVPPEVLLCTKTGNFPIDAVSGGVAAIIDITWQLYMFADPSESFVALIDEPENHLHPKLQKSFMGNLLKAFPNTQFIIATHNPFIITADKNSNVYVMDYNENHKICSQKLDYINRAGTSNKILRDVLGVDSTMPVWAVEELDQIIEKYSKLTFSNEVLFNLRKELSEIGLDDYIPDAIAGVAQNENI